MTDIHAHLLFGVDDGSQSLDESIELIKRLKIIGFNNIILTPHYISGTSFCVSKKDKKELLGILKKELVKQKIDVSLTMGNEFYIDDNTNELLKDKEIDTLNNSKYLLIEFPLNSRLININDILFELIINDIIPVLAHPERYSYFIEDNYKIIDDLKNIGVLFQCNYGSILGMYGKQAKKIIKYMLKNNYVDYLATDIHTLNDTFVLDNFTKIEGKIKKIIGTDSYNRIIANSNNLVK